MLRVLFFKLAVFSFGHIEMLLGYHNRPGERKIPIQPAIPFEASVSADCEELDQDAPQVATVLELPDLDESKDEDYGLLCEARCDYDWTFFRSSIIRMSVCRINAPCEIGCPANASSKDGSLPSV